MDTDRLHYYRFTRGFLFLRKFACYWWIVNLFFQATDKDFVLILIDTSHKNLFFKNKRSRCAGGLREAKCLME